jgi:hypothetical protein
VPQLSPNAQLANDKDEHFIMRDANDVKCGYALFLLRLPESGSHVEGWIGKSLVELAHSFLASDEFSFRLAPRLDAQPGSQPTFGIVPGDVSNLFRYAMDRFCGLRPSGALTGMSGWRWTLFWLLMRDPMREVARKVTLARGSVYQALCEHVTWDQFGSLANEALDADHLRTDLSGLPRGGAVLSIDTYGVVGRFDANSGGPQFSPEAYLYGHKIWPVFQEADATGAECQFFISFEMTTTAAALERAVESKIQRQKRGDLTQEPDPFSVLLVKGDQPTASQPASIITCPPETKSLQFWTDLLDLDLDDDAAITRRTLSSNRTHWARATAIPQIIAFYLPQFYPFPENNSAWGEGFSEWTNVVSAPKLFADHASPLIPADLGFYDLRSREVRARQAELALQNGISGFCYYFYWFAGRQVMGEVIQRMLRDGQPSLPFCLCWANENWSRRWDGSQGDVIIAQSYDAAADAAIVDDLARFFDDPRYIRIDGAPLFLIYHLSMMPEPAKFILNLRKRAKELGFLNIILAGVLSHGEPDPIDFGCDFGVQFPPHEMGVKALDPSSLGANPTFEGQIYDYEAAASAALAQKRGTKLFPGVMPRWDNAARRGSKAHLFHKATPQAFEAWLRTAIAKTRKENPSAPFVFVNSWNEWAEGAVLEPDRASGRAYLDAVRNAVSKPLGTCVELRADGTNETIAALVHENKFLGSWLSNLMPILKTGPLRYGYPPVCSDLVVEAGQGCQLQYVDGLAQSSLPDLLPGTSCLLEGSGNGELKTKPLYQYLLIEPAHSEGAWFVPCVTSHPNEEDRDTVPPNHKNGAAFQVGFQSKELPPGTYRMSILEVTADTCFKSTLQDNLVILEPII